MKVLITGSHFTPAQAVIEKLLEIPEIKIVYLGRKYARDDDSERSVESQVLPKLGVKFIPIIAGKLNRFFSLQTIISFLKTPVGFIQSFYYLSKEKPDLIVSFGGFIGLPVVICSWLLSMPSLIHEQSLKMGLSNLISSFFANKVAVSFGGFKVPSFLNPEKFTVTGNPIRAQMKESKTRAGKEFLAFIEKSEKRGKPILLVTAGNQGSHILNLNIEDRLKDLTNMAFVIHQTGSSKFDDFSNLRKYESENYIVRKWIDAADLSYIYEHTDLCLCRGGMNTLLELSFKSVPALIVPIQIGNEQKNNAAFFTSKGLGEYILENKLTPNVLVEKIKSMLEKKSLLKKSAKTSAKGLVIPDGEKRLVQEILLLKHKADNPQVNF